MSERAVGVGILGTGFARSTQIPCFEVTPGIDVLSRAGTITAIIP